MKSWKGYDDVFITYEEIFWKVKDMSHSYIWKLGFSVVIKKQVW